MATIVAQASGNWSNPATWAGGVVPGAGDTAQTGNYIVTIDASVTCTLNPTGSGYFVVATGGITITGDVVMQSSYAGGGLRCTHGSGTVTVGTATGGAGSGAHGAFNNGAGTMTVGTATGGAGQYAYGAHNQAAGTMTVGTATGGAGNGASGAANAGAGTLTVGAATGGAGGSSHGAANVGAGTMTVGTATGGAGVSSYGAANTSAGTMTVDLAVGNNWGVGGSGGYAYGVYGSGVAGQTTTAKRIQSGPYGAPAIGGAVLMVADASNSAQFRTAYGGATLTLTDPSASADWPAEADVRAGVEYDLGDKTGTAHIPAAGQVALGVPVDATTGTAVLTAAAVTAGVWDAARSGHATDGTFGDTAEWAGSGNVDEAAIAAAVLSAMDAAPPAVNVTYSAGVAVSGRLAERTDLPSEPLDATATQAAAAAALTAYDPPTNAEMEARTLVAASYATAAALDAVDNYVDTEIAAIKAKTDNLPSDPADQSAVEAAITAATSTLATAANLATLAGYVDTEVAAILAAVDTEVAAIKAKTDNLPASPAAVGSAMTLTAAYDAAKTAATQTSVDDLPTNAELAAALAAADDAVLAAIADVPTVAEFEARTLPAADYTVVSDLPSVPSAASVADAVWDEALSGHAVAGSAGAALSAAGAAGDPWSTALPGAYGAGTAGKLLADLPTAAEMVAAMDADPPAVNVTHHAGVAVAAADANGNVPVDVKTWKGEIPQSLTDNKTLRVDVEEWLGVPVDEIVPTVKAYVVDENGDLIGPLSLPLIRDAMKLAPSAGAPAAGSVDAKLDDILTTIGSEIVEGTYTRDDILRIIAAALAGKTSGSGTSTVTITGLDGATTRIIASVDGVGNRTAMTLDGEV